YGYIINHKKIVKNKQARTRERKSEQKPEAKPGKVKPSVKVSLQSNGKVKSVNPRQFISSLKLDSHVDMEKAQRNFGFQGMRLKDWRARQERLEASPTGYK
ncbi:hypothetical protein Tco_0049378, partial [Tanacetum coccineum]